MKKRKITLAELRLSKGLSQREFANQINVSSGVVGMWETGKRMPSLSMAKLISQYFGVSIEEIEFVNLDESNKRKDVRRDAKTESTGQVDGQISLFAEESKRTIR